MIAPILSVCPSFKPVWDRFCEDWADEKDPPIYIALSALAEHIICLLRAEKTVELKQTLDIVEAWILGGDHYVKNAAIVGLLEDLQNKNLHECTEPDTFIEYLSPETLFWWRKVEKFWRTGDLLIDDRK